MAQIIPAKGEAQPDRRKHRRRMVCGVCGHEWQSYGYGVRIVCPKCYEARTGKKLGPDKEKMAELRAKRARGKTPEELPAPPPRYGPVDRFLKWFIGGGEQ